MATADRYIKRGDYTLHVRHTVVNDDVNTPTYVLLHGWSGNYTCFEPLVELLNKRGFNTVVPDLRGHGLSSKHRRARSEYEYSEYVSDLDAVLKALDIKRASALGYSAGGTIALKYQVAHPGIFDRLVLVGANHANPLRYMRIGFLTKPAQWCILGCSRVLKYDKRQNYKHIDLTKIKSYWGSVFEGLQSMPKDVNLWLLASYGDLVTEGLETISIPALVLRGAGDPFFTAREARELTEKLQDGRCITVPAAGHYLVTEHSDQLLDVLDEAGALKPPQPASDVPLTDIAPLTYQDHARSTI